MSAALAHIEEEGTALIRSIARREPAKVISFKTGITPRHVYNLREYECQPRWLNFMAMAQNYPELRAAVGRWLGFDLTEAARAESLEQIRRIVEAMPEEGDQV
jgi:hypothetical protein